MRRFTIISLIFAILLVACTPTVTLLPLATPTVKSVTPIPTALPPTPIPPPTRNPQMGISTDALRGLTISLWHGLDGQSASLMTQQAAEFNLTNPWGITVNVMSQGNLAGLLQAVDNGQKGQGLPDAVLALPEHLIRWNDQGLMVDLNPYVDNPEFGFAPMEIDDIPASFWLQDDLDGVRLGVPAMRTARFVFYNVSRAKELGFNTPPKTADEFRQQACAANAAWKADSDLTNDGYGGWAFDSDPWTAYSWLRAAGGEVVSDGEYAFSSSQNQVAVGFLFSLRQNDCIWLPASLTNNEYLVNRAALFITGSLDDIPGQNAAFRAVNSPDVWTVLPFPGKDPALVAYGPSYGVLKSNPARQLAAWLFVRWMLSPERQARWASETGLFPVRSSALDLMKAYRAANPQWSAAADLMSTTLSYPQMPSWGLARTVLGDGFDALFRSYPLLSVDAVLKEMDATLQELHK